MRMFRVGVIVDSKCSVVVQNAVAKKGGVTVEN